MADIHTKLASIAGRIGSINKTERNKEQGFNFRSIEQITAAIRPLLAAEGISVMPRIISREYSEVIAKSGSRGFRCIAEVEYTFTAGSDGSQAVASMIGEAADYGDKATSKAVQMAYKYALTQVLQVGSGDDPDGDSVDVGHVEEPKRQRSGMKRTPTPEAPQTPPNGSQTHLTPEQAIQVATIKKDLLGRLEGDIGKAAEMWSGTLVSFGLDPEKPLPADMIGAIEHSIKSLIIKGEDG